MHKCTAVRTVKKKFESDFSEGNKRNPANRQDTYIDNGLQAVFKKPAP